MTPLLCLTAVVILALLVIAAMIGIIWQEDKRCGYVPCDVVSPGLRVCRWLVHYARRAKAALW